MFLLWGMADHSSDIFYSVSENPDLLKTRAEKELQNNHLKSDIVWVKTNDGWESSEDYPLVGYSDIRFSISLIEKLDQ